MESINCILCQTPREDPVVIEENGFKGRKCAECGLIYVSPRPSFEETIELYVYDKAHLAARNHFSRTFLKRRYARHHLAILKRFSSRGKLLEIGAGGGLFLDEARRAGFKVHAVELNDVLADHTQNKLGIPCERRPLAEAFGLEKFDVIYHCDVLSHFYNPILELQTIYRRLTDRGLMIFETGNLADVKREFYPLVDKFQYPDHLFFFGQRSLRVLLERTGFEILGVRRYSTMLQLKPGWFFGRLLNVARRLPGRSSRDYLTYLMRYKIGYFLPKEGRHQTLIVVAGKVP